MPLLLQMPQVEYLNISFIGESRYISEKFPPEKLENLQHLPNLQTLVINYFQAAALPDMVYQLPKLQRIELMSSKFRPDSIPAHFTQISAPASHGTYVLQRCSTQAK